MREIRWHGRGGQGAKSVSELLAAAMLRAGYQVQAFPEYGPERSGAPLQAYTRYSTEEIRLHCGVVEPDGVVVLDESLLGEVDVTAGLKQGGLLLVNSASTAADIARAAGYGGPIVCLDAGSLAAEAGARHGNVVMVGALALLEGKPELEELYSGLDEIFGGKLSGSALAANRRAIEIGFREAGKREIVSTAIGQTGREPLGATLRRYDELALGGVLPAEAAGHPHTGSWRTEVKPQVVVDRCVNCLLCWVNCPDAAVVLHGTDFYGFDHDYCKGCELCSEVCPTGAIEMVTERTKLPAFGRVEEVLT